MKKALVSLSFFVFVSFLTRNKHSVKRDGLKSDENKDYKDLLH